MDNQNDCQLPEPVRAEAAVWLARLHSDVRSEQTERSFKAWLADDPSHAAAFERLTNTWDATGILRSRGYVRVLPADEVRRPRRRFVLAVAGAMAAATAAVVVGVQLLQSSKQSSSETIMTVRGERRSIVLSDGSHLVLNTDSRVSATFTASKREIVLEQGQVRFEVAKDPDRPFVVRAGGKRIVALGTAFDVRWTDARLSIVLFEGRVTVLSASMLASLDEIVLSPGERLEFQKPTLAIKSQPQIEREEAWVGGRAIFEATPLHEAIAEINRYSRRQLRLADPGLANLPISGTFSVDDAEAFARGLAEIFSLEVDSDEDGIVLKRG
jgi:transmembrane sensor